MLGFALNLADLERFDPNLTAPECTGFTQRASTRAP